MEQLTYSLFSLAGTWELSKGEHWEWYLVLIHLVKTIPTRQSSGNGNQGVGGRGWGRAGQGQTYIGEAVQ